MDCSLQKRICTLTIPISVIIGFLVAYRLPYNASGKLWGIEYNLIGYFLVIVFAFLIYVLSLALLRNARTNESDRTERIFSVIYLSAFGAFLAFMMACLIKELEVAFYGEDLKVMFLRENDHRSIVFIILFVVTFAVLLLLRNKAENKMPSWLRKAFAILAATIGALFHYAPNAFLNQFTWFYHVHAYTNSIVNVMRGVPYNDATNGIYGHYGIIYWPFVKMFGDSFDAILITIAIFAFLTYLAAFYVCDKLISNDVIFIITVIAGFGLATTFFGPGNYFQTMPCRVLFPMLTVAFVAKASKIKNRIIRDAGGIAIGSLAIVFNTETGLICTATLVATWFFFRWEWKLEKIIRNVIFAVLGFVISFIMAWGMVDAYNLLCGGDILSVKQFIYPIGSSFVSSDTRVAMPDVFSWHTFEAIVFGIAAFTSVGKVWQSKGENPTSKSEKVYLIFAVGVTGLSTLMYYVHRCAPGNISVSRLELVILLGFFANDYCKEWSQNEKWFSMEDSSKLGKKLYTLVACFLVCYLAIEGFAQVGNVVKSRTESVWDTKQLRTDYEYARSCIPENIPAFGMAIQEIYYQLGINPQTETSDWSGEETPIQSIRHIENILVENDDVITSNFTSSREDISALLEENGFTPVTDIDFQNFKLVLFHKGEQ